MGHALMRTKPPSSELIASHQLLYYLRMQLTQPGHRDAHTYTDWTYTPWTQHMTTQANTQPEREHINDLDTRTPMHPSHTPWLGLFANRRGVVSTFFEIIDFGSSPSKFFVC
jgi:hypothetical protein